MKERQQTSDGGIERRGRDVSSSFRRGPFAVFVAVGYGERYAPPGGRVPRWWNFCAMSEDSILDLSGGATAETVGDFTALAHSFLELQVLSAEQQEFRLPFIHREIALAQAAPTAFSPDCPWVARLKGEEVSLHNREDGSQRPLTVGTSFEYDASRIWLLDARCPPVGTLLGLSSPYVGRVWNLTSQQTWLGRKGKRLNHIEVNHPTISRTHLTFLPDEQGQVELLAESGTTVVNGQRVAAKGKLRLQHGALVGCGELLFRFSVPVRSEHAASLLKMKTLGTFSVLYGGRQFASEIKNEKAQFLFAALAVTWGDPRSVDWLLAQFWPEVPVARGRKNLSYTLVQLRENLGIKDSEDDNLFIRSTCTVQLNPERLEDHDFCELNRLTKTKQALTSRSVLERVLLLHGGRFLPACYDDWAEEVRHVLERDFSETLMATARYFLEKNDFSTLCLAAGKLLELDPLHEEAATLRMEGALQASRPELAVATYDNLQRELRSEGLEPSTAAMKLYYRAKLGL